ADSHCDLRRDARILRRDAMARCSLRGIRVGPDDAGAADSVRRRLPRDADRIRADDRPRAADGGSVRAQPAGACRRRVRRRRGEAVIATLFGACIVLLALGVPVAFALGVSTLAAILVNGSLPLVALPKYLFSGIDVFALMAVPFFILTAELMTGGALSE